MPTENNIPYAKSINNFIIEITALKSKLYYSHNLKHRNYISMLKNTSCSISNFEKNTKLIFIFQKINYK